MGLYMKASGAEIDLGPRHIRAQSSCSRSFPRCELISPHRHGSGERRSMLGVNSSRTSQFWHQNTMKSLEVSDITPQAGSGHRSATAGVVIPSPNLPLLFLFFFLSVTDRTQLRGQLAAHDYLGDKCDPGIDSALCRCWRWQWGEIDLNGGTRMMRRLPVGSCGTSIHITERIMRAHIRVPPRCEQMTLTLCCDTCSSN